MLSFLQRFKVTFKREYLKLRDEQLKKNFKQQHEYKMATDREYNDAHILKLAKEYIKHTGVSNEH